MNKTITKNIIRKKLRGLNKKSQLAYFQLMFMFIRIAVLLLVLFSIVILVHMFVNESMNVQDEEVKMFPEFLLYSKYGLSHYDQQTNRVYPGILNYAEITNTNLIQAKLDHSFDYGNYKLMAIKFNFVDLDPQVEGIQEFYYKKERYDEWMGLTGLKARITKQFVTKKKTTVNVIIRKEAEVDGIVKEQYFPARLELTMLSPNT